MLNVERYELYWMTTPVSLNHATPVDCSCMATVEQHSFIISIFQFECTLIYKVYIGPKTVKKIWKSVTVMLGRLS